ncbi:hypothetical protein FACS1894208_10770 [Clostridia bacterium]|nr:hypothetical protein FACS1894208_10770 [Clostridia bacterium]
MNDAYTTERQATINSLSDKLKYLESRLNTAKQAEDDKQYLSLMRVYIDTNKLYLRLVAEAENTNAEVDALTAFNAGAVL